MLSTLHIDILLVPIAVIILRSPVCSSALSQFEGGDLAWRGFRRLPPERHVVTLLSLTSLPTMQMWSSCWSPCPLHVITKGISCLASELMFIMFIQVFILLYLQLKTVFFRMSHGRAPTLNVGKMDKALVYQICNFWCTFFKNLHFLQVESCLLWKFAQLG
jgi:hypothetical protein